MHVEYLARELAPPRRPDRALLGRTSAERRRAGRPCAPTGRGTRSPGRRRTRRRSRRSRSTSRWRPASRARRSCTATPGTPTSPGTWPSCCTGSRTSRPCTAWSRCGRGRTEQLGGGYAVSSFCERTALEAADAIVAVSREQARDVLACYPADRPRARERDLQRHRHRAVPARSGHRRARSATASTRRAPRSSSWAGSRGRRASRTRSTPRCSSIRARSSCSARARRTRPEIAAEIEAKVARVRAERGDIIWIDRMLPRDEVVQIVSHATVFLCPSIYEPLGIVNLEAMACETAVVATRTGGIPEVVEDGVTGLLVPFEPRDDGSRDPVDPERFARDIAERVNELLADPGARRSAWGRRAGGARSSTSPGRRSRPRRPRSMQRLAGALTLITWRSPAELLEHALGCSRLVLMNEAHDGLRAVCGRARSGWRSCRSPTACGVRHLAMEAFWGRRRGAREHGAPPRGRPRRLSRPARDAGARERGARPRLDAAHAYEGLRLSPARRRPRGSQEAINWREDQQARNLGAVVTGLQPSAHPRLVRHRTCLSRRGPRWFTARRKGTVKGRKGVVSGRIEFVLDRPGHDGRVRGHRARMAPSPSSMSCGPRRNRRVPWPTKAGGSSKMRRGWTSLGGGSALARQRAHAREARRVSLNAVLAPVLGLGLLDT